MGARLYNEPQPSEIDNYEQRGDGCWYPKDTESARNIAYAEAVSDAYLYGHGYMKHIPVGDITSDEKGTGARFNSGKVPMNQIPFEQQLRVLGHYRDPSLDYVFNLLEKLAAFERGEYAITNILAELEITDLHAAAFVFDYGAQKYKQWNWMKGMPWSVPLGCISRHAQAIIVEREELDRESGLEHWGHIVCNVIMLAHYSAYYKEGNDLPNPSYFRD